MNQRALITAALLLALGACGRQHSDAPTGTAPDTVAAATASDEAPAVDTDAGAPDLTTASNATGTMSARELDAAADRLKRQADANEPADEAQADRLEEQAKDLQQQRDARK